MTRNTVPIVVVWACVLVVALVAHGLPAVVNSRLSTR